MLGDSLSGRIPVGVITGFLGSGKTTLINRLVKRAEMDRVAVIVNELGEIGVDNDLVETASEQMMLLNSGCLCCTLRSDLQETLRELFIKRRNGDIIQFDRVLVETTGIADPAPVMQTLMTDTLLLAQYRLDGVSTLVDSVNAPAQIDEFAEALKQIVVADRLVLTKSDLASEADIAGLQMRLRTLNPRAPMASAVNGEIDPALLIDIGNRSIEADSWLGEEAQASCEHSSAHTHETAFNTFSLRFDEPLDWQPFSQALDTLTALRGADLLRVKGLVNLRGRSGPTVIQGVQHLFHPPLELATWPSDDHSTRLVFITRGIERTSIEGLFGALNAIANG